jgi:organic radical activating enzyme
MIRKWAPFQTTYTKIFNYFNYRKNTIIIYPTLRCNLKCVYCVNEYDPKNNHIHEYNEISGHEWLKIIKKTNCEEIIITGGEPTLYKDLFEIINHFDSKIIIKIYTNFLFNADLFKNKLTRNVILLGSYHPSRFSIESTLKTIKTLTEDHRISGHIHIINSVENRTFIQESVRLLSKFDGIDGWTVSLDPDQRLEEHTLHPDTPQKVICRGRWGIIAPDGVRYPCVAGMVSRRWQLEDLKTADFSGFKHSVICNNWGNCAPCDGLGRIKIKKIS